jgi:outer membrane murein-binding lipoprotein Lpp
MAMVRGKFLSIAIVLGALCVWGCNQGNSPGGQAERIRALEAKVSKLEDDYRAAATVRDQARKKAVGLEEERAQLQKDLEVQQEAAKLIVKERDELRQIVETRTNERDVLLSRCERLKKGLQNLLGQDDGTTPTATTPTSTPSPVSSAPTNLNGQS